MLPYKTKDLNEPAFLWCQEGTRLKEVVAENRQNVNKGKPETFYFVFDLNMTDEELRELMYAYANGETKVEPQTYVAKQGNLRDRLYAVRRKFRR